MPPDGRYKAVFFNMGQMGDIYPSLFKEKKSFIVPPDKESNFDLETVWVDARGSYIYDYNRDFSCMRAAAIIVDINDNDSIAKIQRFLIDLNKKGPSVPTAIMFTGYDSENVEQRIKVQKTEFPKGTVLAFFNSKVTDRDIERMFKTVGDKIASQFVV